MKTSFYLNTNFSKEFIDSYFENFIKYFYDQIDFYCLGTERIHKEYHIVEYGEMSMINFFAGGIIKNDDINRYIVLNEFGMENIDGDKTGRADIIIEDTICHEVYYVEAKKLFSNENTPMSDAWKKEEAEKYYQKVLGQANKYLEADIKNFEHRKVEFFKIALIFDSVRFEDVTKIKAWHFEDLDKNEFYAFKTYKDQTIGLACYGKIEKYVL